LVSWFSFFGLKFLFWVLFVFIVCFGLGVLIRFGSRFWLVFDWSYWTVLFYFISWIQFLGMFFGLVSLSGFSSLGVLLSVFSSVFLVSVFVWLVVWIFGFCLFFGFKFLYSDFFIFCVYFLDLFSIRLGFYCFLIACFAIQTIEELSLQVVLEVQSY
jgi:hypothetical protein